MASVVGLGAEFPKEVGPGVLQIGRIEHPRVTECSGVFASRRLPGVFWIHNDGGGPKREILYAISRVGKTLGEFRVAASMTDWEDIAGDSQGHLYLADTGNNEQRRTIISVHEITEPDLAKPGVVGVDRSWRLAFPGPVFDCEALFVWGTNGYVISKVFKDRKAEIYRFPLTTATGPITLEAVAKLRIESPVTGADISADGTLLAVVAKSGAFVFAIDGDVARADRLKPFQTRFKHEHIEGCTFVPEGLLATSESREIYLYTSPAFRPETPLPPPK